MARLRTGVALGVTSTALDGNSVLGEFLNVGSYDTTIYRSNGQSVTCASTGRWAVTVNVPLAASTSYFFRCYFYFAAFPSSDAPIVGSLTWVLGTSGCSIRITSAGALRLWNDNTNSQIGSNSSALNLNTWTRIEMKITLDGSSNITTVEGAIDGSVFATGSTSITANTSLDLAFGWVDSTNRSGDLRLSDIAVNDSTGSDQNSYPGEGRCGYLRPVSDNSIGNWAGGAGGTSNLWDAVNNLTITGVAAASETNTTQIKNGSSGASSYDANCAAYTDAVASGGLGAAAGSTISFVKLVTVVGSEQTSADTGSQLIVSNPTQSAADTFSFNRSGGAVGAVGIKPTSWFASHGAIQYSPTVTLGTAPVIRVTKTQTQARIADCCWMGLLVEWVEPAPTVTVNPRQVYVVRQAVNRSAVI